MAFCLFSVSPPLFTAESLGSYASHRFDGRSLIFTTASGQRLRITPYGNSIVRVQTVRKSEDFYSDDHYEMIVPQHWDGFFTMADHGSFFVLDTGGDTQMLLRVNKNPMRISFFEKGKDHPLLEEDQGCTWNGDAIHASFLYDPVEHFTGLGHGFFGRSQGLDLKGEITRRNYGSSHGQQAPLIVPFYMSSKGYGIFLNSTFPNSFNLGSNGTYEFSIEGNGRMDYFFILGPEFTRILDRYTQLTGRPRLPPLAAFGLALSDKGHDHSSSTPSDEQWWKKKVIDHRTAGFPIDHLINDNRWRAGGGKRCESYFQWDSVRFPDPREYERWITSNGLLVTIDFNRCIAKLSDGWKPFYNIPVADSIDFGDSAPDFTRKEVRNWFWHLFWRKSVDPQLQYPGDALWIDEFDEMGKAPSTMALGDGRSWLEMKNYWFFLIAKALVEEGWDNSIGSAKRPFVWVRGMTAGAQRYATLWSGDIKPTYDEMKLQVRGMQLAGLSGFPFWGHDAGGFYDWENRKGPDDAMYRQWSMAFGSFTPFWKPHGMGHSRWPLDRSSDAQKDAKTYGDLRYGLIPYTYTYAHKASETGVPIARAMLLEFQQDSLAWKHDLQYMWGRELLVAPNCSEGSEVELWLPKGDWYDFWNDSIYAGGREFHSTSPIGRLPLFVKAGSIIPMAFPALSTAFIQKDKLILNVYTGANGAFTLYEDDGKSELYRTKGEMRSTQFVFNQSSMSLSVGAAAGTYNQSSNERSYRVVMHGLTHPICVEVNGSRLKLFASDREAIASGEGRVWDKKKKCLTIFMRTMPVERPIVIKRVAGCKDGDHK